MYDLHGHLWNPSPRIQPLLDDDGQNLSRSDFYSDSNNLFKIVKTQSNSLSQKSCFIMALNNPLKPSIHPISCTAKLWRVIICASQNPNENSNFNAISMMAVTTTKNLDNLFRCINDVYISVVNVCDGKLDCPGEFNDESNCTCTIKGIATTNSEYCSRKCLYPICTCSHLYRQKISGGCDLYTNNELVPSKWKKYKSKDLSLKIWYLQHDYDDQCPEVNMQHCQSGLKECYYQYEVCQYHLKSGSRTLSICINGKHLENCRSFQCFDSHKCYNSYCIPFNYVCDGKWDCWDGADEAGCRARLCSNLMKCRYSSTCIPLNLVCNAYFDCPYSDDEQFCSSCVPTCYCLGMAISCDHTTIQVSDKYYLREYLYVAVSWSYLPPQNSFWKAMKIYISNSYVTEFWQVFYQGNYSSLYVIDMTYDHMKKIKQCPPNVYLNSLNHLNLSNNIISEVSNYAFISLVKLHFLDLSFNKLNFIANKVFAGLYALKAINLRKNYLFKIDYGMLNDMPLQIISTDHLPLCCKLQNLKILCTVKLSLERCRKYSSFKMVGFLLGLISIIGLLLFTLCLAKTTKEVAMLQKKFYLILTIALHVSGIFTCVYIFILVLYHTMNGIETIGEYILWKKNTLCILLLNYSYFSILFSSELTFLIGFLRFLIIVFSTKNFLNYKALNNIILFSLMTSIVLAGIICMLYFQEGQNVPSSLCFLTENSDSSTTLKIASVIISLVFLIVVLSTPVFYFLIMQTNKRLQDELETSLIRVSSFNKLLATIAVTIISNTSYYVSLFVLTINSAFFQISNTSYLQYYIVFVVLPVNPLLNPVMYNMTEIRNIFVKIMKPKASLNMS